MPRLPGRRIGRVQRQSIGTSRAAAREAQVIGSRPLDRFLERKLLVADAAGEGCLSSGSRLAVPKVPGQQGVRGAPYSHPALVEDVGVNHRGPDARVAEELLDGADVVAVFQEVGGERMAEGVTCGPLRDAAPPNRLADRPLDGGRMEVVVNLVGEFCGRSPGAGGGGP